MDVLVEVFDILLLVILGVMVAVLLALIFIGTGNAQRRRTDAYYTGYLYGQYGSPDDYPKACWARLSRRVGDAAMSQERVTSHGANTSRKRRDDEISHRKIKKTRRWGNK